MIIEGAKVQNMTRYIVHNAWNFSIFSDYINHFMRLCIRDGKNIKKENKRRDIYLEYVLYKISQNGL